VSGLHFLQQKLGLDSPKITDMETIITPLLQMMAECAVNYHHFFLRIVLFQWQEPQASEYLRYEEDGKHSMENLLQAPCDKNLMEMMLKALAQLHKQDDTTGEEDPKTRKDRGKSGRRSSSLANGQPMTAEEVIEQQSRLPYLSEMASRFKLWAAVYAARLRKVEQTQEQFREKLRKATPKRLLTDAMLIKVAQECADGSNNESKASKELIDNLKLLHEDEFQFEG
jgi:uncharacterized protein YdiU (UPF0061 family)